MVNISKKVSLLYLHNSVRKDSAFALLFNFLVLFQRRKY